MLQKKYRSFKWGKVHSCKSKDNKAIRCQSFRFKKRQSFHVQPEKNQKMKQNKNWCQHVNSKSCSKLILKTLKKRFNYRLAQCVCKWKLKFSKFFDVNSVNGVKSRKSLKMFEAYLKIKISLMSTVSTASTENDWQKYVVFWFL